jgi:hypothetical protein
MLLSHLVLCLCLPLILGTELKILKTESVDYSSRSRDKIFNKEDFIEPGTDSSSTSTNTSLADETDTMTIVDMVTEGEHS